MRAIRVIAFILMLVGTSSYAGYRIGKRQADKWWAAQPAKVITPECGEEISQ